MLPIPGGLPGGAEGAVPASTVPTRVNNVRSVLRAAVRDKYLAADPSEEVVLPRRRRAAQAMRIPTPAEVGAVIDTADDWFKTYVRLCAFAGLRLGEASGIQLGDVAFLERRLQVRRQVQRAVGPLRSTVRSATYTSHPSSRKRFLRTSPRSECAVPSSGCSSALVATRPTGTPSTTVGRRRLPPPESSRSSCTTAGTSSRRASSQRDATS